MSEIITIGEIIVEVMAVEIGQSFIEPGKLKGPFSSGAPAIFINQAAMTGSRSGIIGVVGDDDFGRLNINALDKSGVEVDMIRVDGNSTTGTAFVAYEADGSRDFIFHLKDSAAGRLNATDIKEEYFDGCNILHIMGSSLFNEEIRAAIKKAVMIAKNRDILISFDPNIRKELMKDQEIKTTLEYIYDACDIFMPSEGELTLFNYKESSQETINNILKNKKYIVLKRGKNGCIGYSRDEIVNVEGFEVEEIDPTGAGDTFGGTFISCLNQGYSFAESLRYANISGALAVTKKGPMEGSSTLEQILKTK